MTTVMATHEVITGERALDLLCQVVAAVGETFVYRKPAGHDACVYAHDGAAACLVGHALIAAGARLEDLDRLRDCSIDAVSRVGRLWLEWDAGVVFNVAQLLQDEGATWGAALQAASDVFDQLDYTLVLDGAA
jgi:hypothetical protein